jgi:hypothetical protein
MKVTYTVHDNYVGTQDGKPTGDRKATVTDKSTDGRQIIDALRHDNMLAVGHYPHAKITVHEVVDDE